MNAKKKLLIINILLIVITFFTYVTAIVRSAGFGTLNPIRVIFKIAIFVIIVRWLLERNKWGYILCLLNGYLAIIVNKLLMIPLWPMFFSDILLASLFIFDTLVIVSYVVLGHLGLVLSKKVR